MKKLAANRLLQHLFFWAFCFYVLWRIFATAGEVLRIDLIYTAIFILTLLPGLYLNLLVLIPKLLARRNYAAYGVLLIMEMTASAGFNILMFSVLVDYLIPGYYFISYYDFFDLMKFIVALTAAATLLKLSKGWFLLLDAEKRWARVEKENTESKLLALKSQLNPHFLFNSLSGIYSMVLKQSPQTPGVVLLLSDFLRYILYDAVADRVSLEGELGAIRNYIELQRLRAGPEADIAFIIEGDPKGHTIAPLLFLPLLENSFKHGIKGDTGPTFARFLFRIGPQHIESQISNNKGNADEPEDPRYRGIGLQNLRQRLEMLYPGNHTLAVSDNGTIFVVDMQVPLHE